MPAASPNRYSLDTNVLISAWLETYPPEAFASFWDRLDELIMDGRALISEEVYEELGRKEDGLFAWVKQRPGFVIPHSDAVQEAVTRILRTHPLLIKARKHRSGADPFVIAVAMCEKCRVVTHEGSGSEQAPRIPDVCRAYKVDVQPLRQLIRDEGWKF